MKGRAALALALGVSVSHDWPPPLTGDAIPYLLPMLEASPTVGEWLAWIWILRGEGCDDVAVGLGGFYGPPDADGMVGCGYSVLPAFHRRGIATEAMRALVDRAFRDSRVAGVWATTFPDHEPSLGVMRKLGMHEDSDGPLEEGRPTVRWLIRRAQWRA